MKKRANGIDIEVEDSGAGFDAQGRPRPVVLLIMGLGMQLTAWPPAMVQALVDAGYRVVRFDNRDAGLSQHFDALGKPKVLWAAMKYRLGWRIRPPYSLLDMARDTLGVLDALGIDRAHAVGASMGGMIAQRLALLAPERVLSLASVMSSSGARGLPEASRAVTRLLMRSPGKGIDAAIDHSVRVFRAIGSSGFPMRDAELRELVSAAARRSLYPVGILRQMVAVVADSGRADELAGLKNIPTLVVHGKVDPLVPFACGEDTARRIPGARLAGIDGMGHDLPPGVVERLLDLLMPHFESVRPTHT